MHTDNLSSTLQYTRHVMKVNKLQNYVHGKAEEVNFHMFLKKMTLNYLEKETFRFIMRKKKLMQNLYLKLRNTTATFL